MAAAPFMGPIAGPIAAGLGSYKTYGKINPMAMAMSLAPHIKTGGYGDWGGGKSIRGLLTGKGPTGSGRGILGKFGNTPYFFVVILCAESISLKFFA